MASFVLDENIIRPVREELERAGFKVEQISIEVGPTEHFTDEHVIYYLRNNKQRTFITRNVKHFYRRHLQHSNYSLLCVEAEAPQVGEIVRRVLRLPQFRTKAKRMGKIIRASVHHVWYQERGSDTERMIPLN
ncbi:DUF5615 family PIN-like protein [Candidatus Poribacteria bacterium]|nr:DUF5615 family PIN-like protein [Candidatus Poribacteria bacterium]